MKRIAIGISVLLLVAAVVGLKPGRAQKAAAPEQAPTHN
jgi:hypothetical protein